MKILIEIYEDDEFDDSDMIELYIMFKILCDNIGNNGIKCIKLDEAQDDNKN